MCGRIASHCKVSLLPKFILVQEQMLYRTFDCYAATLQKVR